MCVGNGGHQVQDLLLLLLFTCCLYWEKKINVDIDWSTLFKRNLAQFRESKLREFNLKLLYNLLPIRSNLFKWGISNDDVCSKFNIKEDINLRIYRMQIN